MSAYADTGFLCSLYAPDAHTKRASARMRRQTDGLVFTWLHQVELRNALRLRVFRREIQPGQREAALNAILADLADGVLAPVTPPLVETTLEAERLSATFAERIGSRSLDLLHVAAALVLGSTELLTFDARQAALAKAAGLKTPKL